MKTLIIGASGLVGGYLYKAFFLKDEVIGTSFPEKKDKFLLLDIRDRAALEKLFSKFRPEVVLCPAAISNVEFCQQHPDECRVVNIDALNNLIQQVKRNNCSLVFFSSEYVFDGRNGPYSEDDIPLPINEYGRQKLEAEKLIQEQLDNYIIVRTTVVYGWEEEGKNFVTQMLKSFRAERKMKVPLDQFSSPTYAADLASAVSRLVSASQRGVFNIVGPQVMNRYEFAKIVCDVFNLDSGLLVPVKTSQLNQKAARPLAAGLKIDKLNKIIKTTMRAPFEGLGAMKKEDDAGIYIN